MAVNGGSSDVVVRGWGRAWLRTCLSTVWLPCASPASSPSQSTQMRDSPATPCVMPTLGPSSGTPVASTMASACSSPGLVGTSATGWGGNARNCSAPAVRATRMGPPAPKSWATALAGSASGAAARMRSGSTRPWDVTRIRALGLRARIRCKASLSAASAAASAADSDPLTPTLENTSSRAVARRRSRLLMTMTSAHSAWAMRMVTTALSAEGGRGGSVSRAPSACVAGVVPTRPGCALTGPVASRRSGSADPSTTVTKVCSSMAAKRGCPSSRADTRRSRELLGSATPVASTTTWSKGTPDA
mmetsp:Transcript_23320/g.63232  ORF Transcript_23320/g.63232 Transcript_23320/m.63232 type:complete len:303 (+) Transcript_23320:649-1557(+)